MSGPVVPLSVSLRARSHRRGRRDFALAAGDEITLAVTVYQDDLASVPLNVGASRSSLFLIDEASGWTVLVVAGAVVDAAAGRLDIVLLGSMTVDLPLGRYLTSVNVLLPSGQSAIMRGAAHIGFGGASAREGSGDGAGLHEDVIGLEDGAGGIGLEDGSGLILTELGEA